MRSLGVAAFALLVAIVVTIKAVQHASFGTVDYDTGIYSNLVWNLANGHGYWSSILDRHHLGEHFSPIVVVFAPLYWIHATPTILLVAQGLAVALTFAVLPRLFAVVLADLPGRTRTLCIALLLVLFLLYRPQLAALYACFHPSTLGMPLVALGLLFLHRGSTRGLALCVAVLLLTKELAVATIFGFAVYAGLVLGRWRTAAALAAVGSVAGAAIFFAIMPAFRDGSWYHLSRVGPLDLPSLKLWYLVRLAAPLGLLPFFGPRALVAALPTTGLNLALGYAPQLEIEKHYDDQNCVFWIAAAAHGARRVALHLEHAGGRLRWAVPIAMIAIAIPFSHYFPPYQLVRSWPRAGDRALAEKLAPYAALPPDAPIAAQHGIGPHLNLRRPYRMLSDEVLEELPFSDGEIIAIAPGRNHYALDVEMAQARLAADPRAELIEKDATLEIYRWRAPQEDRSSPNRSESSRLEGR